MCSVLFLLVLLHEMCRRQISERETNNRIFCLHEKPNKKQQQQEKKQTKPFCTKQDHELVCELLLNGICFHTRYSVIFRLWVCALVSILFSLCTSVFLFMYINDEKIERAIDHEEHANLIKIRCRLQFKKKTVTEYMRLTRDRAKWRATQNMDFIRISYSLNDEKNPRAKKISFNRI